MTRDPKSLPRAITAIAILVAAVSLLGSTAAMAQDDCTGFQRRDVISGGTNGVDSIHIVDVDGDGDLDVVSASFGDGSVYWFENDWDANDPLRTPSFQAHLVSDQMPNGSSVYAADLDDDTDIDIIGASRDVNRLFWYEQARGISPIFTGRTISSDTELPLSVFAADVNGDGNVDIVSASFLDNKVAWHENVPPGEENPDDPPTFVTHVITTSAPGAASVFVADVDGDDDLDVLAAARLATPPEGAASIEENWGVAWYEHTVEIDEETQDPVIVFVPREVRTTSAGATSVYAADVDGDGDTDVLSATNADNTIAWHENDGNSPPRFTEHPIWTDAQGARRVVAAFVNNDDLIDVLSASQTDDTIAWYRNEGGSPPTFSDQLVVADDATDANDVRVGDLDNDGDTDIVSASSVPGFPASQDAIRWYENVGPGDTPQFAKHDIYYSANGAVSVVAADLDGDGSEDVATAGRTNQIAWFHNDGAALPGFQQRFVSMQALNPSDVAAGDLDGDGDVDLVSSSRDDDKIAWYENDGTADPAFVESVISTNVDNAWDVYVTDLDGDMDLDILAAANVSPEPVPEPEPGEEPQEPIPVKNVFWFRNDGAQDPQFTEILISQNAGGARSVFAADLDEDGDLDVLVGAYDDSKVVWYENEPGANPGDPPTFAKEHVVTELARGVESVVAADLNGDMQNDIIAAEAGRSIVAWYDKLPDPDPDTGEPVYSEAVIANSADGASSVVAADLNGDDTVDVVAVAPGDQAIAWFDNLGGDPPLWETRVVTLDADFSQKVELGFINGDDRLDLVSGSRLSVYWYEGSGEICQAFDVNEDDSIDGIELIWMGRSFGLSSADPGAEWWGPVDFNGDGMIDGEDLAILTSPGVFGTTTETCSYVCQ